MAQKKITGTQVDVSLNDLADVSGTPADGQVLTFSSGAWAPQPAGGGGIAMNAFRLEGLGDFGGSLVTSWSMLEQVDDGSSSLWTFDSYTGGFECQQDGLYEVVVDVEVRADDPSNQNVWPNGLTSYGIDIEPQYPALVPMSKTRHHTRYAPSDLFNGNFGLSTFGSSEQGLTASRSSFTERILVQSATTGIITPRCFAGSYSGSGPTALFRVMISFMRVGDYIQA